MEQNDCRGSGDVVIVVPSMDCLPGLSSMRQQREHHICIDAEPEPPSPKTITESSSEFETLYFFVSLLIFFCFRHDTNLVKDPSNKNILNIIKSVHILLRRPFSSKNISLPNAPLLDFVWFRFYLFSTLVLRLETAEFFSCFDDEQTCGVDKVFFSNSHDNEKPLKLFAFWSLRANILLSC